MVNIKLPVSRDQYILWPVANTDVTGFFMENDHIGGCMKTVSMKWPSSHWPVKLVQVMTLPFIFCYQSRKNH